MRVRLRIRRRVGCKLCFCFLQFGVERCPGTLVRVVRPEEDAEAGCVVGDAVGGIVICVEVGFFDGVRGKWILTDLRWGRRVSDACPSSK